MTKKPFTRDQRNLLHKKLKQHFRLEELRAFYFEHGGSDENVIPTPTTLDVAVRAMISHQDQRNELCTLLIWAHNQRPKLDWTGLPIAECEIANSKPLNNDELFDNNLLSTSQVKQTYFIYLSILTTVAILTGLIYLIFSRPINWSTKNPFKEDFSNVWSEQQARFYEDFTNLSAEWATHSDGKMDRGIKDGQYCMSIREPNLVSFNVMAHKENPAPPISVKITRNESITTGGPGLIYGKTQDSNIYYGFLLTSGNKYSIYKFDSSKLIVLASGPYELNINGTLLGIATRNNRRVIEFYINEKLVQSLPYDVNGQQFGVMAFGQGNFCFDDFSIYDFKS